MKILIIGSGGREHAIGDKIKKDNLNAQLFFSLGNGGTQQLGENVDWQTLDELADFAEEEEIDLTIVGSEALLVEGIVDTFHQRGLQIIGPDKKSALLEGSKEFAKDFMVRHGIKTASYKTFNNYTEAYEYAKQQKYPLVIKADGLAAGKGVIICQDEFEAKKALDEILNKKVFGEAGNHVVIEEFLQGFEASILSIFNGKEIVPFISAKDHKKSGDGETGLNTGGMGVVAPNPFFTEEHWNKFTKDIVEPTLKGLLEEKLLFTGFIFFGLMITDNGVYLLEYNMRLGDPETQAVLPLMNSNFLQVLLDANEGKEISLEWKKEHSVCVVMTSGGYPLEYEKGLEIKGLDKVTCPYYIAGAIGDRVLRTSGGRVLNVVGQGKTLEEARAIAYENLHKIQFDYNYYRKDIGEVK